MAVFLSCGIPPGTYFDREACVMQFKDVAEMYNSITGASGDTNINSNTGFVKADVNYYTTLPEECKTSIPVERWNGRKMMEAYRIRWKSCNIIRYRAVYQD